MREHVRVQCLALRSALSHPALAIPAAPLDMHGNRRHISVDDKRMTILMRESLTAYDVENISGISARTTRRAAETFRKTGLFARRATCCGRPAELNDLEGLVSFSLPALSQRLDVSCTVS
jgi:hypothetical protein